MNNVPGLNLCATNVMLRSHALAKEIIAKFIIKRFHILVRDSVTETLGT